MSSLCFKTSNTFLWTWKTSSKSLTWPVMVLHLLTTLELLLLLGFNDFCFKPFALLFALMSRSSPRSQPKYYPEGCLSIPPNTSTPHSL